MSDDNFDDGLIHAHHWATEKPTAITAILTGGAAVAPMDGGFDDGLVHSHDWASAGN